MTTPSWLGSSGSLSANSTAEAMRANPVLKPEYFFRLYFDNYSVVVYGTVMIFHLFNLYSAVHIFEFSYVFSFI